MRRDLPEEIRDALELLEKFDNLQKHEFRWKIREHKMLLLEGN
jgi:hypothetical protein